MNNSKQVNGRQLLRDNIIVHACMLPKANRWIVYKYVPIINITGYDGAVTYKQTSE